MSYDSIHRQARKRMRTACRRCRSTKCLQAALNPAAPVANLRLDPTRNCRYSICADDYLTLCARCHYRMDHGHRISAARFQRVRRNAPSCDVCGEPMMAGQHGTHLSCARRMAP
jgi:hypothetical protein